MDESAASSADEATAIEDERGVDVGQIRRQLRLSVPERVRAMVEVANVMLAIQAAARVAERPLPR